MQTRFDKTGRRLPDTGRGCGCQLCADSDAPRYERRGQERANGQWSALRRSLARVLLLSRSERAGG
jgi:hypothetical protein